MIFSVATSLVHLCKLRDAETQRLALQTLELLAIENSDVIVTHVGCASWFSICYVFKFNTLANRFLESELEYKGELGTNFLYSRTCIKAAPYQSEFRCQSPEFISP